MIRKVCAFLLLLMVLAGCASAQPALDANVKDVAETTIETTEGGTGDQETEGSQPDQTGDQSQTSEEPPAPLYDHDHSQCRAVGYEYDEDTLVYDLVWFDEFDYEGLPDSDKWGYDIGGSGWGNGESQFYTEGDNVLVKDGMLTITARKESHGAMEYTSTRLISKNKGDFLYGRIEVMAKLPSGRGTWPAIWMLPTDWKYGGWPRSGEIDIMEHVGFDQGRVHGTVHTDAYNHMKGTQLGKSVTREDVSSAFHLYAIEWLPDKIKFFVDDKLYFIYKPSNLINHPGVDEWPFDQRFHLLLNIAVGGAWGGAQGIDDSIFPQEMVVDYVRVYQSETITNLTRTDLE